MLDRQTCLIGRQVQEAAVEAKSRLTQTVMKESKHTHGAEQFVPLSPQDRRSPSRPSLTCSPEH